MCQYGQIYPDMIKNLQILHEHKLQPMDHQQMYYELSRDMPYYAYFWEMGTGKTKPMIDTMAHLFIRGEIDGVVVISDNGCYMGFGDEIDKHMSDPVPYRVAYWSSYQTRQMRDDLEDVMAAQDDTLDILLVNVEAFSGGNAAKAVQRFIQNHYCMMIVDEATSIKNIKSARTRAIMNLGKQCDYRRIATGTPITQSPMDLYSMCEFLQPGVMGFKNFTMFKSYYAIVKQVPSGRWHYDVILGYNHLEQLTASIQPFSSRLLKSECLDLPGKTYETIYVEQTPQQESHYKSLKSTAILELEQGLLTSTTAVVTIMKLHQINCGHVKLDDGSVVDISSNRVPVLLEQLDKMLPQKVVVWCRFQRDVQLIIAALKEKYDNYYGVHYYGETSDRDRQEHLYQFVNDDRCKWFIGTASTGGKGINGLQEVCSYEIYYSNSYDREDRAQSEDRLDRKGQRNPVTIIDLVVKNTVDVRILDTLKRKEDLAFQILDRFRQLLS